MNTVTSSRGTVCENLQKNSTKQQISWNDVRNFRLFVELHMLMFIYLQRAAPRRARIEE